ncbi:MAG TPA: hypothetical protein VFH73_05790 [Polyangia bacterium]|jgi:hypothetical protein|nr:hypothetical protein [Polyangia bacterium]
MSKTLLMYVVAPEGRIHDLDYLGRPPACFSSQAKAREYIAESVDPRGLSHGLSVWEVAVINWRELEEEVTATPD